LSLYQNKDSKRNPPPVEKFVDYFWRETHKWLISDLVKPLSLLIGAATTLFSMSIAKEKGRLPDRRGGSRRSSDS
jgi:hypothetical protein